MAKYTTKAKLENFLNKSITEDVDTYLLAADRLIDQLTGRNFKADTIASARLFDGDGSCWLLIDDCIDVSKVEIGNDSYGGSFTEIDEGGSTGYFLYPKEISGAIEPFYKIVLMGNRFGSGLQNHKITAKWGYSELPPADIVMAATILAAGMYNAERGGGSGAVKSESIGNYSVAYDIGASSGSWADFKQALMILQTYKKVAI